jgi:hypothetical protein
MLVGGLPGKEAWRTKNTFLSLHQNAWQTCSIKIANKSFENSVKYKYMEATATNQNCIQEEVQSKFGECLLLII